MLYGLPDGIQVVLLVICPHTLVAAAASLDGEATPGEQKTGKGQKHNTNEHQDAFHRFSLSGIRRIRSPLKVENRVPGWLFPPNGLSQ